MNCNHILSVVLKKIHLSQRRRVSRNGIKSLADSSADQSFWPNELVNTTKTKSLLRHNRALLFTGSKDNNKNKKKRREIPRKRHPNFSLDYHYIPLMGWTRNKKIYRQISGKEKKVDFVLEIDPLRYCYKAKSDEEKSLLFCSRKKVLFNHFFSFLFLLLTA